MDFTFKTISEFNAHFTDEKTCYSFLESQRWNGQPVCPHCGTTKKPYNVKPRGKFKDIPSYRCSEKECDLPFTVRTGSIFEGSKVELKKWFQAAYELSISKKGISSVELGERLGVSQKTAWFINHRLRAMLKDTAPQLLTGMVETDESYFGGKRANRHVNNRKGWATQGKTPVVGLLQRDGKVIATKVDRTNAKTLLPLIQENVANGSTVVTDGFLAYKNLANEENQYRHEIVDHHREQYVNGIYHTNGIEGFWSLLKRGVIGTFHSVSAQHLQRYCDEFAYRYNNRNNSASLRFNDSLSKFDTARLTYRRLTEK
jgi:transposase-like protein